MTGQHLKTYVVNLKRRADRRARIERALPAAWDVQFTSDWDGPMDGQAINPDDLPGFELYPWEIPSDNPWWSRPLPLVTLLPKDEAGSDTEASASALSSRLQPDRGGM